MPYILPEDRDKFDANIEALTQNIDTPGELNYTITRIIHDYLNRGPMNYSVLNEIVGVLECCKLEFVRRVVSLYEDEKIEENGDVHPNS